MNSIISPQSKNRAPFLYFNDTVPENDLEGTLAARVQFAQSQIIPSHPKGDDRQPILTNLRDTLILVQPLQPDLTSPMYVQVLNKNGEILKQLVLNQPSRLPVTAYHIPDAPDDGIDFTPLNNSHTFIDTSAELAKLKDPSGLFLKEKLSQYALVEIKTANGLWVSDIYLPDDPSLEGKMVRVKSSAGYKSNLYYAGRKMVVSSGDNLQFKFINNQWFREDELELNAISYAPNTWSVVLPGNLMTHGITLSFFQGNLFGKLTDLKISGPCELLINTIDIGMLVSPRNEFYFSSDKQAQREYFQTTPFSWMIVNQYAPLYLPEVMLPDGSFLTDKDPGTGGWHTGTMCHQISRDLVSKGINSANYGINSSSGTGQPYHFRATQVTMHNSRGNYANGIQVHGGMASTGVVSIDKSYGNEISHELGHSFSLADLNDGFRGCVHRSTGNINSTWGWDSDKNIFIPNFKSIRNNASSCFDNQCQPPFHGYQFGYDAMNGGEPLSSANRYTLYTPNSSAIMQSYVATKALFDPFSPTGFSKWNVESGKMDPYESYVDIDYVNVSITNINESLLADLVNEHNLVNITVRDGQWAREIIMPAANSYNNGHSVTIDQNASWNCTLYINGNSIVMAKGFKKSFTSDGVLWQEEKTIMATQVLRVPERFGIPVTTLVGYYDPNGLLQSYIYPALFGAYGFCYADDEKDSNDVGCKLLVETEKGIKKFILRNSRASSDAMNKFHINIPTDIKPTKAIILRKGKVIAERELQSAPTGLLCTIHGKKI
ncbi:Peptidase M66 [Kosakonia arachidis]|uniref:Peptidase M66 n=1 Tax=Kosakonia arachidis TaxID=551989 RepID=A0A1I7E9H6_9ENTR|nr:M66 family metalloprotease [Kosakonia arachidis]SFU20574.1 Peptidase M66 [Kosakonia arachidis]